LTGSADVFAVPVRFIEGHSTYRAQATTAAGFKDSEENTFSKTCTHFAAVYTQEQSSQASAAASENVPVFEAQKMESRMPISNCILWLGVQLGFCARTAQPGLS